MKLMPGKHVYPCETKGSNYRGSGLTSRREDVA